MRFYVFVGGDGLCEGVVVAYFLGGAVREPHGDAAGCCGCDGASGWERGVAENAVEASWMCVGCCLAADCHAPARGSRRAWGGGAGVVGGEGEYSGEGVVGASGLRRGECE